MSALVWRDGKTRRIELAGGLYHVTAHGDRREAIYFDEEDHLAWLRLVGDVCERFNWHCHAYCQMTNHYHAGIGKPGKEECEDKSQF